MNVQATQPQQPGDGMFAQMESLVKAESMAYVMFERRDVEKMTQFLTDFGLILLTTVDDVCYFRGHGTVPWLVSIAPSTEDRFVGLGLTVATEADLHVLASTTGVAIELADGPAGGKRVRLTDPEGLVVDAVYGAKPLTPLPTRREKIQVNTPLDDARINSGVRPPLEPSAIFRFGHVVLQRPDFMRSASWYMRHFGFIPSDIQTLENGQPVLGFFRLNRGAVPSDHHSIAILGAAPASMLHVSFQTFDIDSVGQGHQYLRARGWTPFWGIGRHRLGSQIFDYWKDPVGNEWEHYADGDVFDAEQPTGYQTFSRGTLWAWGDDLPDSMRPDLKLDDIPKVHAAGGFGDVPLDQITEFMRAMLVKPRPWLK